MTYARAVGSEDEAVDALEATLDAVEQAGPLPLIPIIPPSLPAAPVPLVFYIVLVFFICLFLAYCFLWFRGYRGGVRF